MKHHYLTLQTQFRWPHYGTESRYYLWKIIIQVSKVTADFMCPLFGVSYLIWKELLFTKMSLLLPFKGQGHSVWLLQLMAKRIANKHSCCLTERSSILSKWGFQYHPDDFEHMALIHTRGNHAICRFRNPYVLINLIDNYAVLGTIKKHNFLRNP